jgi:hypothetical protein
MCFTEFVCVLQVPTAGRVLFPQNALITALSLGFPEPALLKQLLQFVSDHELGFPQLP